MKRIITLLFAIFYLSTNLFSQDPTYDNNSRWFWGLNAGGTWHTSDVKNRTDLGLGLTLGRSFNYNYGKIFSFDIRARGLFGSWVGQDRKRTDFTLPNEALSSGETNYKDTMGFAYRNFSTSVNRLSLELVIHLNSVREKTKIDPYIFGGIGYTWYRAKGNYLDGDSQLYDFASWGDKLSKEKIDELQDVSYETILDGSSTSKRNVQLMPSVGFGIGYQFAPRFTMGLEHKTTFTGLDNFDGVVDQNGTIKNDWYHYTSLYMRFYLKPGTRHRTNTSTTSNNYAPNGNDQMQPPRVVFTNPSSPGTTTSIVSYPVRADIFDVFDRQDVTFTFNGNKMNAFTFNPSTRKFESLVSLKEGENTLEISGRNVYGFDNQTTTIIYKKPDPVPPIVSFQNPPNSPTTVNSNIFELDATVLNVDQKSQVRMQLNGSEVTNFTFNASTKKTRATLNLNYGTNVVQLTGTNPVGTDSKTTIIIYNRENTVPTPNVQPPVVYFVNPSSSPSTSNSVSMTLTAKVLYVLNKQNVTFKQNGQLNYNFDFNPNSQDFRSNVTLVNGQNVFEIVGLNKDGSAQATTLIIYQRQAANPPIVTITYPTANPHSADREDLNYTATVLNVSSKNQVEVKVNGQVTSNFTFTNSTVNGTVRLGSGTTTIEVKGTNNDGVDQKQTVVTYRKPVVSSPRPPIVTITYPTANPHSADREDLNYTATVLNVSSKNQVEVKVNGQVTTDFTFTNSTVIGNIRLGSGTTTIEVKGTNNDGVDQKQTVVSYRKPVSSSVKPPVVTITSPATSPFASKDEVFNFTAQVLNVTSKNQIEVKVNGQVTSNFEFISGVVQASVPLQNGSNTFEVRGTNQDGTDYKQAVVTYRKPMTQTVQMPEVDFVTPKTKLTSTNSSVYDVVAQVKYVENNSGVNVTLNGATINNFDFNPGTDALKFRLNLNVGANTIVITGTNSAGSDSETTSIYFNKALNPEIFFTNPARCPASFDEGYQEIKGYFENVNDANEVTFMIGGKVITNAKTEMLGGKLMFTIPITVSVRTGDMTIQVIAENAGGRTEKSCLIKPIKTTTAPVKPIVKPVVKPVVKPTPTKTPVKPIVVPTTKDPILGTPSKKPTIIVPTPEEPILGTPAKKPTIIVPTTPTGGSTRENPPKP